MSNDKSELITTRSIKKRKILFTVLIVFELVFAFSYLYDFFDIPQYLPWFTRFNAALLILLLQTVFVLWVLEFDLRVKEAVFFLLPTNIFVASSMVVLMGVREVLVIIGMTLISAIGYYVLVAATNILNVSTIRPVPLKQAALSSIFFIGMLSLFLLSWRMLLEGQGIEQYGWIWLAVFLFGVSFLYLSSETGLLNVAEIFVFGWIVLQLLVLANFWPSSPLVVALVMIGWSFVVLGILYHHINRNLSAVMKREYLLFSLLLLAVFFLL